MFVPVPCCPTRGSSGGASATLRAQEPEDPAREHAGPEQQRGRAEDACDDWLCGQARWGRALGVVRGGRCGRAPSGPEHAGDLGLLFVSRSANPPATRLSEN